MFDGTKALFMICTARHHLAALTMVKIFLMDLLLSLGTATPLERFCNSHAVPQIPYPKQEVNNPKRSCSFYDLSFHRATRSHQAALMMVQVDGRTCWYLVSSVFPQANSSIPTSFPLNPSPSKFQTTQGGFALCMICLSTQLPDPTRQL